MDGIYSAADEVDEASLFAEALRLAGSEVTAQLSAKHRRYAEHAVKGARGIRPPIQCFPLDGIRLSLSRCDGEETPWGIPASSRFMARTRVERVHRRR